MDLLVSIALFFGLLWLASYCQKIGEREGERRGRIAGYQSGFDAGFRKGFQTTEPNR